MKAHFKKYQLHFKSPVLTSRGRMEVKNGYYLFISANDGETTGTGECSFIDGLSIDNLNDYEEALQSLCMQIENGNVALKDFEKHFPSIAFGYETALLDLKNGGKKILFESEFTRGEKQIPINGLVWMGSKDFMREQIQQKLNEGFRCIKLKVVALDFAEEVELLKFIRTKFPAGVIEIRLDANGAFTSDNVFEKLEALSKFQIHSIEQPVKQGQHELMQSVCASSPIPVALDEELIGVDGDEAEELLSILKPSYIILKPSLLGGLSVCDSWIAIAEKQKIKWWATSALESNIGLNAIAQWVFEKSNPMVQGLGTGSLYTDNISSPLFVANGMLGYNSTADWQKL